MSIDTIHIDTIHNNINYLFDHNKNWRCVKTPTTLRYVNRVAPLDEFIIESESNTSNVDVSIPLNDAIYKTKFIYDDNDIINYIKMHVNNYNKIT
jgi:hypothetical protein